MRNIKLWEWASKKSTPLRNIKVGDIICYELDPEGSKYSYGQLIAKTGAGFVFRPFNIIHTEPNDLTVDEILNSSIAGKHFILDVYTALDKKKYHDDGEWRIIGHESDFKLSEKESNLFLFSRKIGNRAEKINILGHSEQCSLEEADNLVAYGPYLGDQAKKWFIDLNQSN